MDSKKLRLPPWHSRDLLHRAKSIPLWQWHLPAISHWNKKRYMGVSQNNGTPQIMQFNRVFHYKPSILGYPYFWKHPYILRYRGTTLSKSMPQLSMRSEMHQPQRRAWRPGHGEEMLNKNKDIFNYSTKILVTFNWTMTFQSLSWVMTWNLLKRSMTKMGNPSSHRNCSEFQTCSGTAVQSSHGYLVHVYKRCCTIVLYHISMLYTCIILYAYCTVSIICSFKLSCTVPLFQHGWGAIP